MKTRCRLTNSVCLILISCCLGAFSIAPSWAAQLGDMPVTAEFSAAMRAIAAMDPDEKIRNPDTMAKKFLSPAFWFWTALDEDYDKSKQFIKYYRVSTYYTSNACTKHIDGILESAAGNGLQQVVIIGAGLDSRAYRFQQQTPKAKFFEVDLPAAVACKKELVQSVIGKVPETVAYVSADYRNGGIGDALIQAGYNNKSKTLFIWEGVTRYIDAESVDGTLRFIAENAAPGSELVFDYIFEDITQGDFSKMPFARFQSVRMAAYGHPWKFGIAPEKAGDFVKSRGFEVISDLGAGQLAKRYLVRSDGGIDGTPAPYFRIMHAVVKQ